MVPVLPVGISDQSNRASAKQSWVGDGDLKKKFDLQSSSHAIDIP